MNHKWNAVSKNYFQNCQFDVSFVWLSNDCAFDRCSVVKPPRDFASSKDFSVALKVVDSDGGFLKALEKNSRKVASGQLKFVASKEAPTAFDFTDLMILVPAWKK